MMPMPHQNEVHKTHECHQAIKIVPIVCHVSSWTQGNELHHHLKTEVDGEAHVDFVRDGDNLITLTIPAYR